MDQWHVAYTKLASLLNELYDTYRTSTGQQLYKLCASSRVFRNVNPWFDRISMQGHASIDPIQVFSSINENKITDIEREKRLNSWFAALGMKDRFKGVNFKGCPAPFSLKIISNRSYEIQNEVWQLLQAVMQQHQEGINRKIFRRIKDWYGIDISSFTIFLFWIDSSNFIPLDQNTTRLLQQGSVFEIKPNTYEDYIRLLKEKDTDFYRELATQAFYSRGKSDFKESFIERFNKFFSKRTGFIESADFKLVAIKPLPSLDRKYLKVLKINRIYSFYEAFNFDNEKEIIFDSTKVFSLYSIRDHQNQYDYKEINISAIAGKNGTGKSSITELLYLTINNLAQSFFKKTNLLYVPDVYVRLYFYSDTLYQLDLKGGNIKLVKFAKEGKIFYKPKMVPVDRVYFNKFFYSIAINYSHHALNSRDLGYWVDKIFYKNDGYQTPLVINPMRREGVIDINRENELVKTRLLANILEPDSELRKVTENGRSVAYLRFQLDKPKGEIKEDQLINSTAGYRNKIIKLVYHAHGIHIVNKNEITRLADRYIYKKLVRIALNYPAYNKYFNKHKKIFHEEKFLEYLFNLEKDKSHITYKLKQAINYLRYDHLKHHDIAKPIDVAILSQNIQNTIARNFSVVKKRVAELMPPSFFKVNMILSDGSDFEQLSSGEKQRIHTVNSLVYHLLNLDSVARANTKIKYECVNVLFDEVELYFHPEMQRTFVNFIVDYLKRITLPGITGINFCFVTHSPFILSDIPDSNVMFLRLDDDQKAIQIRKNERTFGGNIHELLQDSFFLEKGYMGDFAKFAIRSATFFLEKIIDTKVTNAPEFVFNWDEEKLRNFIEFIGEPLIRNSLRELFLQAYSKKDGDAAIDREIARLEKMKSLSQNKI